MIHTNRASTKHNTTATCLFETVFRIIEGMYLLCDQRDVVFGDNQKVEEDDTEDTDDEDEDFPECSENLDADRWDGVTSSLGLFSRNGSLCGEVNIRHTVRSRNPMVGEYGSVGV